MPIETPESAPATVTPRRPFWRALRLGFARRCPACGHATVFRGYLKVHPTCAQCGLALGEFRSDDAPPYFTLFIVGHIVLPLLLWTEQALHPPEWVHYAIWPALTLVLALVLLPRVKGAVIGAQWATRSAG